MEKMRFELMQSGHYFIKVGLVPERHWHHERSSVGLPEQLRGRYREQAPHGEVLEVLELFNGSDDITQEKTDLFRVEEQAVGEALDNLLRDRRFANTECAVDKENHVKSLRPILAHSIPGIACIISWRCQYILDLNCLAALRAGRNHGDGCLQQFLQALQIFFCRRG